MTAFVLGVDAQSMEFLRDGLAMGKMMGLFGVPPGGSASGWLDHHADWIKAASQTAWGVFSCVT